LEQEFNNEIQNQAEYLYRKKSPVYSLDIQSQAVFGLSGFKVILKIYLFIYLFIYLLIYLFIY